MNRNSKKGRRSPGCGVSEHRRDCLCDVVITEPAPVRFRIVDLPGARAVMRLLGMSNTPSDDELLRLAASLVTLHSAARSSTRRPNLEVRDGRIAWKK